MTKRGVGEARLGPLNLEECSEQHHRVALSKPASTTRGVENENTRRRCRDAANMQKHSLSLESSQIGRMLAWLPSEQAKAYIAPDAL